MLVQYFTCYRLMLQGSARSACLPGEACREGSAIHQEDHFMTQVTTTAFHAVGLMADPYSLRAFKSFLTAHICHCRASVCKV